MCPLSMFCYRSTPKSVEPTRIESITRVSPQPHIQNSILCCFQGAPPLIPNPFPPTLTPQLKPLNPKPHQVLMGQACRWMVVNLNTGVVNLKTGGN